MRRDKRRVVKLVCLAALTLALAGFGRAQAEVILPSSQALGQQHLDRLSQ